MAIEISSSMATAVMAITLIIGTTFGLGLYTMLFLRDWAGYLIGSILITMGIFSVLFLTGVIVFVK